MRPIEQWIRCCLDAEYYQSLRSEEILFDDRYVVQHSDHWTLQPLIEGEVIASPGFFPGVKQFYPANQSTEKEAKKEIRRAFEACEGNCNTCKFLERFPFPKHPRGFMTAFCTKKQTDVQFHPEDPMLMECYEGR